MSEFLSQLEPSAVLGHVLKVGAMSAAIILMYWTNTLLDEAHRRADERMERILEAIEGLKNDQI